MVQKNCLDKILIVLGPTGIGKSALAVYLAEKFNGEIISADSVAIYKGLNIGSAKPNREEMHGIPHHMIDVVSPFSDFSVSDYEKMALDCIRNVLLRGKLPILCGGTGFYINSVLYKMSYGNHPADLKIRQKYEKLVSEHGENFVYNILKDVDEVTAEKLHPNDVVRVIRALEIYESTGVKKSDIKDEKTTRFDFVAIMPVMNRSNLYKRIDDRVELMFGSGLKEEVEGLIKNGITLDMQCMQGIGYKETATAILQNMEIPIEKIKLNSRHYAKRQLTFFKKTENLFTVNAESTSFRSDAEEIVRAFLKKD